MNNLNKEKLKNVQIACIFLSPKLTDSVLDSFKEANIRLFSLFYSENLVRYQKYINSGGIINSEGNYSSFYLLFNRENFVEFFKKISKNYIE